MQQPSPPKRLRGFAAMTPERRQELASKGGQTSQAQGTAHQWTAEEARAAGKKSASLRRKKCQKVKHIHTDYQTLDSAFSLQECLFDCIGAQAHFFLFR